VKILLVEDEQSIAELLREALTSQRYLVDLASDGQAGWELAEAFEYDLILLDLMLPKLDGISFCRNLRAQGDRTPILLLTGHETSTNKVMGLDAGADDYLVKPFDLQELLARIRALLRRGSATATPVLEWENLRLDPSKCEVTYDGQPLRLTAKEYALLELFLRNTQRIYSQSALLDHLWSFEEPPSENTVRAHIKSLRQKLKKAGASPDLIETVYGLGYRLKSRELAVKTQKPETVHSSVLISHQATEVNQTQSPIPPEMMPLWERFKDKYSDRIIILEQAVIALLADSLTEELRQQALREAHTLVGSLGSFGLNEASRLSREIEHTFQAEGTLSQAHKEHLSGLVVALRQELEQPSVSLEPMETLQTISLHQSTTLTQKPRLLVVDDDTVLALALVSAAKAWGMQAEMAYDLSQAREAIAQARPDIVLLDLCFPDSVENGFGLLAELTTYQPPVPVLVFTAQENFADRVKVARLGGRGFLQKPVSPTQVMDAIAQVLQQSSTPGAKLLIVDDDPQLLDFLRTLLEPWGFKLTLLDDPQQFWDTLEQTAPDLLILDVEMPELSGIDLCQVVRNDPRWSELPVLILSARTDAQTLHQVFTVGADDYVSKPVVGPELVARVLNRLERTQILHKLRKLSS
jgi:DNA-binding response OmpR family regulator